MYRSTKTYGHDLGLSACFRQHGAHHSHCSLLHGYALSFTFVFEGGLDDCNWVVDFGGLKLLKESLTHMFDHRLLVAEDDPYKDELCALAGLGLANVVVLKAVGCEAFANIGYNMARSALMTSGDLGRVSVVSCEVKEHGANSAIYIGEYK
jgi:6-pyruvoyltetrahydropterin/6-carboxytetrahydropterin synthase